MPKNPKSARTKVASDDVYNARKRFARSSLRNLKKADKSSGATAAKYRQLATEDLRQAIETYDKTKTNPNYLKEIRQAAAELGIDITQKIEQLPKVNKKEQQRRIDASFSTLEKNLKDEEFRRVKQARTLLSNDEIGSRIYGSLVDIWKKDATVYDPEHGVYTVDNKKIEQLVISYFNVDNIADVLDKLEELVGEDLYSLNSSNIDIYEYVKLTIQEKIVDNTLVQ